MKHMEAEREIQLLRYLKNRNKISHGGGRIVYEADSTIVDLLELDTDKEYVIKVAMGQGGMAQNNAEVDTFLQYGYNGYLAEIFAAGRYTLVMERVEIDYYTDDYTDLADSISSFENRYEDAKYYYGDCAYDEDEDYVSTDDYVLTEDDKKVIDVIGFLADVFGSTADNGQIGWTADHRAVAYDYGFYAHGGVYAQTSDLRDIVYDNDTLTRYLCGLIGILDEERELIRAIDEVDYSMIDLEKDIINDYNEEYDS